MSKLLAKAEKEFKEQDRALKYSDAEARDYRGEWTNGGGDSSRYRDPVDLNTLKVGDKVHVMNSHTVRSYGHDVWVNTGGVGTITGQHGRGFFDVNIPSNGTKSYEQNITLSYGNAEHFATDTPAL